MAYKRGDACEPWSQLLSSRVSDSESPADTLQLRKQRGQAAPRQCVAGLSLPEALILPLGCHVDSPATAGAERQVHQGCEHSWNWQRPRGNSAVGHRGPGPARKGEAGTRGEKGGRGLEGTTDACLSFWEGAEDALHRGPGVSGRRVLSGLTWGLPALERTHVTSVVPRQKCKPKSTWEET